MKKSKNNYNLEQLRALYEDFKPELTFDYHQLGILSQEMISEHYERFISESISRGKRKLLIITGKGKVVKPHVRSHLSKDKRVKEFRKAGIFQGGDGAFEVELI